MAIDRLADMADKIMDAGTPAISSVSKLNDDEEFRRIVREEIATAVCVHRRSTALKSVRAAIATRLYVQFERRDRYTFKRLNSNVYV